MLPLQLIYTKGPACPRPGSTASCGEGAAQGEWLWGLLSGGHSALRPSRVCAQVAVSRVGQLPLLREVAESCPDRDGAAPPCRPGGAGDRGAHTLALLWVVCVCVFHCVSGKHSLHLPSFIIFIKCILVILIESTLLGLNLNPRGLASAKSTWKVILSFTESEPFPVTFLGIF